MQNKKGNVAVIATIIVIVAITAGVVGWMFAKKTQVPIQQALATQPTVPVTQTQPVVQQPTTQPIAPVNKPIVYVNKISGYQISLPSDWLRYAVVKDRFSNDNFQLPTTITEWTDDGKKGFGTVFSIVSISLKNWTKTISDCGNEGGSTWHAGCFTESDALGKNNTSVFVATWPNSGPSVEGDVQWGKLAEEVNNAYLKNNFEIIK